MNKDIKKTDTYESGWSGRDSIPTKYVDDDVDDNYNKMSLIAVGSFKGSFFGITSISFDKKAQTCCNNPSKYKNIISANLQFWSCKNCGADLGDV